MYKSHCVYSIISWRHFAVNFKCFNCSKYQVSLRGVDFYLNYFAPPSFSSQGSNKNMQVISDYEKVGLTRQDLGFSSLV